MAADKFWDFLPGTETSPPELHIYGTISSWENEDTVTAKQFSGELDALGNVPEIIVRINSGGGDVFAATAIFTKLKNNPAKVTVKIDGWAASAATIVAMAGDNVQIARNGVFMIHDPSMVVFGSYQAEDFEKLAGELKVVKQSIVNTYWMKTGKDAGEIAGLMAAETWMTGDKAVESGFCDELMLEEAQTEVEDGSKVIVNGVEMDISEFRNFPEGLLDGWERRGSMINNSISEGERKMEETKAVTTADALKAAYPDLVAAVQNEAAAAERSRIKAIEDMAGGSYADIVFDAKFVNPCTAEQTAVKIIAEQNRQGKKWLEDRAAGAEESGVNNVPGAACSTGMDGKNPFDAAIDALKFD